MNNSLVDDLHTSVRLAEAMSSTVVLEGVVDELFPYAGQDPDAPGGFAAMGTGETLVHVHDRAYPLSSQRQPGDDVVPRVLSRG